MAWMPGALRVPILSHNYTRRVTSKDALLFHIAVTEAASLKGWFNNPNANASSHFYVRRDGTIEQYLDTAHMSWANGAANPRSVTVETQGMGHGSWTREQRESLASIAKFCNKEHGIKLTQMHDSKRGTDGVGYHLLGVPATYAQKARGVSQTGGELWSKSVGKTCPGPDRVPQVDDIIAAAKGGSVQPTATKPKPKPPVKVVNSGLSKAQTKRVQRILADMGHYRGKIDGLYGPVTREAVQFYQKTQLFGGLYPDGDWGPKTEAHYQWVRKLQDTLNDWKSTQRLGKLKVDGDYRSVTKAHVRELQESNGLYRDGEAGPITCKLLDIPAHP